MLNKIIKFLIIILVISLPLVNSHFFDLIGLNFGLYVDGNYEFTKSIFFNIFSGIIITLFFVQKINQKIKIPVITYLLLTSIILSNIFSQFPITSIIGEASKGHGSILFINLLGLFIVIINQSESYIKNIVKYVILGSTLPILFGFKEYCFPSFEYGDLGNRAISTFGHPNYLALYILLIIPFLLHHFKNNYYKIILIFIIILLFLTKSVWGIITLIIYLLFRLNKVIKNTNFKILIISTLSILGIFVFYKFGLITKLNSFISRIFIWETTLRIVSENPKSLLFGMGLDNLSYTFDNFKNTNLYIFENMGFVADRPHNLSLNIIYHTGIVGALLVIYSIFKLFKTYKNNPYYDAILLFLIFTIFNFSSISTYLILIIFIGYIVNLNNVKEMKIYNFLPYILVGILGIILSSTYYLEEHKSTLTQTSYIENKYYRKLKLEDLEKKAISDKHSVEEACSELIKAINSAENYFYCGNLFWGFNKEVAKIYYKKGLKKIPNMWDENSKYYDNYLVKKLFVSGRFYSEKYSNIKEILNRVNSKNID